MPWRAILWKISVQMYVDESNISDVKTYLTVSISPFVHK